MLFSVNLTQKLIDAGFVPPTQPVKTMCILVCVGRTLKGASLIMCIRSVDLDQHLLKGLTCIK